MSLTRPTFPEVFDDETDAYVAQKLRQGPVPPLFAIKLSKHPKGHQSTLRLDHLRVARPPNADHMNALPLGTPRGGHRAPTSSPVARDVVKGCS